MAKTKDGQTEKTSENDAKNSSVDETENTPLDSVNMTIVTSRRVIVDEVTGEISFSEGDEAPKQEAPEESTDDEVTKVELPAVDEDSLKSESASISPEEGVSKEDEASEEEDDMESTSASSSNRRLSKETLFAFALPEPVLQDMRDKAATATDKKSSNDKDERVGKSAGNGIIVGGGVALLLAVAGGSFYFYSQSASTDSSVEQKASAPQSSASQDGADSSPSPKENEEPAEQSSNVEIPVGELSPELIETLTTSQLRKLLEKNDTDTSILILKEVPKRKDVNLSLAALKLADNSNFLVRVSALRAFIDPASFPEEVKPSIVAMIISRLDDEDEIVRGFAAKAIGEAGDPVALTKLRARLDLEESDVVLKNVRAAIAKLESSEG